MLNTLRFTFGVGLLSILALGSMGCATNQTGTRLNILEAQVATITDELVRLDVTIQELNSTIQSQSSSGAGIAAPSIAAIPTGSGPVYKTPSGYEIPSYSVQKALRNAGYYSGTVDGKIGSSTKDAIKAFQRDQGLEADGVVGRQTWNKLKVYLGGTVK